MKIVYFFNSYPNIHKIVAHDEMIEMYKRGHSILVVSNYPRERNLTEDIPFPVVYLRHQKSIFSTLITFLINPIIFIKYFKILKTYIGTIESLSLLNFALKYKIKYFDRIHSHFVSNAALKGYLVAKCFNMPFSCTSHHSDILFSPIPELTEIINNSQLFITISNFNKKYLVEKYSVKPGKIIVNYCGVDIVRYDRKDTPYPDQFTLVSVTGLRPVKGVNFLIETCKILSEKDINFKCYILGGGPDFEKYQKMIGNYQIKDKVILTGKIHPDNINEYLLKASIFVLTSLSEGIPVSIMEAMSMKIPVVTTDITGHPEIIQSGKNGYLVPPKDPQTFSEKIIDLYNNPEKRIAFGEAARKTIEEKFNLEKNVTKFEKLIQFETTNR